MTGQKRDQLRTAMSPPLPGAATTFSAARTLRLRDNKIALLLFILISLVLCIAPTANAANWTHPATELAKAISGATGPGTVMLVISNASSLTKSDITDIQHAVESQLHTSGIRIVAGSSANSDVHITFSENLQGYLWVAEIKQGTQTQIEMVSVPRTETPPAPYSGPSMTIRKTLLWTQPIQMFDAYVDDNRMVLLDANAVSTFSLNSGKWQRDQSLAFTRSHDFPRDLRGLLVPAKDHLADAYLPGTICNVYVVGGIGVSCRDGDDPWPLGTPLNPKTALFNSGRNYFTGTIFPAVNKPSGPFYSLASLPRPNYSLLLLTGVDGRVHLYDGVNERLLPSSATSDWGSDAAAVKSNCGSGTQILVTSARDDTATDSLRGYEIPDRDPIQVSAPTDFPGPITALWTHGDNITAITHNLRTGSYEAYSVSLTCNQ
jgi:hypothetical protein